MDGTGDLTTCAPAPHHRNASPKPRAKTPQILQNAPHILTDLQGNLRRDINGSVVSTQRSKRAGKRRAMMYYRLCRWSSTSFYSGMLSCFFHGFCAFLLRKDARHVPPLRVEQGWITSSTKPRSAATNGFAKRSS